MASSVPAGRLERPPRDSVYMAPTLPTLTWPREGVEVALPPLSVGAPQALKGEGLGHHLPCALTDRD